MSSTWTRSGSPPCPAGYGPWTPCPHRCREVPWQDRWREQPAGLDQGRRRRPSGRGADPAARRRPRPSDVLDLAGNDYLGLRHHPAVVAGAVAAVETYGTGAGASRLVTGTLDVHEELEAALIRPHRRPVGARPLQRLRRQPRGSDHPRRRRHPRRQRRARARLAHRRLPALAGRGQHRAAQRPRARRRAALPPRHPRAPSSSPSPCTRSSATPHRVEDLVALTAEAGALLVIDEAHALGVVGPAGAGLVAASGSLGAEHVVVTTTLSKSLAAQGGAVLAVPDRARPPRQHRTTLHLRHRPGAGVGRRGPRRPRRPARAPRAARPGCTPTPPGWPRPAGSRPRTVR